MDTTKSIIFLDVKFDYTQPSILIETSWFVIVVVVIVLAILLYYRRKKIKEFIIIDTDVELSTSPSVTFKIKRNVENLVIANRIYLELITRKAAIPFDEENDTIIEVYDSLYKLFGIIRDEIKNAPGEFLRRHNPTQELIGLTTKILNEGLRPHLTINQAKFRRWYKLELEKPENKDKTPQMIQKNYPDYISLVRSMRILNDILIKYSLKLEKFISGENDGK